MEEKKLYVRIIGNVQGVSYRYFTKKKADELSLSGWVRNCSDGSVESLISGSTINIALMLVWFAEGSQYFKVHKVITEESDHPSQTGHFQISY